MSESRIKTRSFYRRQLDGLNFPKHGMPADDALLTSVYP
jgi:hypothetical protein